MTAKKAPKATTKRTRVQKPARQHFAIGLPVQVRTDAKPAGWSSSMGRFADGSNWDKTDYDRTFQVQSVGDDNTFEVGGWYWSPLDLEIPYS